MPSIRGPLVTIADGRPLDVPGAQRAMRLDIEYSNGEGGQDRLSGIYAKGAEGFVIFTVGTASPPRTLDVEAILDSLSLGVYGYRGNNEQSGRRESCASAEVIEPVGSLDADNVADALGALSRPRE
jgi:hypothetical protein